MRREVFHEDSNDDQLKDNLDCLDEVREEASQKMAKYQQKMTEYYNKRVKLKRLDIGDLVLHRVTLAIKDSTQGSSGQLEKDLTKSSTIQDKDATIWSQWSGRKLPRPWNIEHLKKYYQQR